MLDVMGVYNESFSMWDYENFYFGAFIESLEGQGASKRVESSVLHLFVVSCFLLCIAV